MSIKTGPAYVVGQGLYNFGFIRERFEKTLTEQGHPAADIEFQAAGMTAIHVLYKIRTAYQFGRGLTDEDYNTCRQAIIDLLFDIRRMENPEVAA